MSLNSRATNVQLNLGPHDSTGPQLLTREFDYKLNTRDAFELNARYPGDDDLYAHEPYEGGYESGSEHDPDVHATPEAPGASLLHGHPIAHPPTKKYKVAKALKTAGVAAGRKVVEVAKATKERLWRPQNKYRVVARSEQPNGGASDSSKAKRAESGNWKRDLGHSLGLDANYFCEFLLSYSLKTVFTDRDHRKRPYWEKDFVY